ncbi:MFS transporter [Actinoplanes bogorensis]|uniref:MFS transporter n=1 Tax=Paractinoplanes bogorensis TaxID=1610840 RepID=A0ABS5YKJ4_9ACTN|nr:MFS transporter [Actinoplanes bogorensis]MBU2663937.1 MFS transporter [Actinoplanes bogorensis]
MTAAVAGVSTRTREWVSVFAVMFFCTWAGNQFSPLLLLYQQKQHYSTTAVNAFLGVYVLGLIPAFLLSGALSDRHGRRPVMLAGVVAALATSVALAFSETGPLMICLGRFLAGVAVGTATCVGTTWLKELSQPPYDVGADRSAGARRAALSFSLGSASGAVVAGLIAQWGPWPEQLPFVIHIVLTLPFAWLVRRVPETGMRAHHPLRVPAVGHVLVVAAPWVFAAAALAYGYLPVLLAPATGGLGIAYATLLTAVALGASALVQPWAKRVGRGLLIALALIVVSTVLIAAAVWWMSWPLGVVAAVVAGAGIGMGMTSGILEVQRIARPSDLAASTGVFYAIAYSGFLVPTLLSATAGITGVAVPGLLLIVAGLVVVCGLLVMRSHRRRGFRAAEVP